MTTPATLDAILRQWTRIADALEAHRLSQQIWREIGGNGMGWNLSIGNVVISNEVDPGFPEYCLTVEATDDLTAVWGEGWQERVSEFEARNVRLPSYSGWMKFVERVGLADWFVKLTDGSASDCRCFRLGADDVARIEQATHRAGGYPRRSWATVDYSCDFDPDAQADYDRLRLEWLYRWARWAVENCERPGIQLG